jgi:hypothetical protein
MSENDNSAQYYQAHKDDRADWDEPERPGRVARRLASMISVRFSDEEAETIRQMADELGESLSHFVREASLQRCRRHQPASPSVTGTIQEINRLLARSSATWTSGGPEAASGSSWTLAASTGSHS